MDPAITIPPLNAPALLRAHNLRPRKSLGQNFLVDAATLEKIVAVAQIHPNNEVLEIGAGLGSLTRYLAESARKVIAVELDPHLLPVLAEVVAPWQNVQIVPGDILKIDPANLMLEEGYLVVANIPYYITSALIRHLLEANRKPARLTLTLQREVAERVCAPAGEMSLLALSVQVYGKARVMLRIPAGAFYPPPKVDSSVLQVDLYKEPLISATQLPLFFRLAKAGFSQKRKTLRNSLSAGLQLPPSEVQDLLESAGIHAQRRAETLEIEEWRKLAAACSESMHRFLSSGL
ncbi:MAG: ribosomal RNA small subunit methyltransferase A [Anaerolineae bacterium]|nr:ribosomal RNA small subunit methyltransferase A [Anaerolineae bacterium]